MQKHNFVNSDYAVSELVGGLILIMIALTTFSAIYMYVFPLPLPSEEINVQLVGYVDSNGNAVIKHMGGESLDRYRVDVKYVDGTLIDSTILNNKWYMLLYIVTMMMEVKKRYLMAFYTADQVKVHQKLIC